LSIDFLFNSRLRQEKNSLAAVLFSDDRMARGGPGDGYADRPLAFPTGEGGTAQP